MSDPCNHAVVGVLIECDGRYLTGLRAKTPTDIAPPAGHVDELGERAPTGGTFEDAAFRAAAVRELHEETGVVVRPYDLEMVIDERGGDRCARVAGSVDGANWHHWVVYLARLRREPQVRSNGELLDLTWRTAAELAALPNLEPIWRTWLRQLRII